MKSSATVVVLLLGSTALGVGPRYTVIDLDTLGGFLSSGLAVSEGGDAAGVSEISDSQFHAFRHDGTAPTDLGTLPMRLESFATSFAGEDAVVITYTLGMTTTTTFTVDPSGASVTAGTFLARGANGAGDLVGNLNTTLPSGWLVTHACWYSAGSVSDLGTLGGANSRAFDINAGGLIVGSSELATGLDTHAASWVNGSGTDLGTLGGARSQATAVNDAGQAAGYAENAAGEPRACVFVLSPNGSPESITDLGVLPGARSSYANGINANGDVVGVSNARAFIHTAGQMEDLNALVPAGAGWVLERAHAINDAGRIVGFGIHNGQPRGFLLIPEVCAGDLDGDQNVGGGDLALLLSAWGQAGPGDLSGDGTTDGMDLALLLAAWGPCPASAHKSTRP